MESQAYALRVQQLSDVAALAAIQRLDNEELAKSTHSPNESLRATCYQSGAVSRLSDEELLLNQEREDPFYRGR